MESESTFFIAVEKFEICSTCISVNSILFYFCFQQNITNQLYPFTKIQEYILETEGFSKKNNTCTIIADSSNNVSFVSSLCQHF